MNNNEVKDIIYHEIKQYFTENNRTNGMCKNDYFKINERSERVIHNDKATIVILDDGTKGVSKCDPADTYNKTKGIKIAYIRAKIKSLQKELKQLLNQ